MSEFIDKEGNLVEAFTSEELSKQVEEAKKQAGEATKEELETLQAHITDLEEQIKTKEEEISKVGSKDYNFRQLETAKKASEAELVKLRGEIDLKISSVKEEFVSKKLDDLITIVAGGAPEVIEKVKFHYKSFTGTPATDEEMKKRVESAFLLATGSKPANPLTGNIISSSGGYVPPTSGAPKGKISEGAKEVAHNLGLSDDELKDQGLI